MAKMTIHELCETLVRDLFETGAQNAADWPVIGRVTHMVGLVGEIHQAGGPLHGVLQSAQAARNRGKAEQQEGFSVDVDPETGFDGALAAFRTALADVYGDLDNVDETYQTPIENGVMTLQGLIVNARRAHKAMKMDQERAKDRKEKREKAAAEVTIETVLT